MKMNRQLIQVESYDITVDFSAHGFHLHSDAAFHELMQQNPVQLLELLVQKIKARYTAIHNAELRIRDASIMNEIWGHYYLEKLLPYLKWMNRVPILRKAYQRAEKSTRIIDILTFPTDLNRPFWDFMSIFNPIIKNIFLKKHIQKQ